MRTIEIIALICGPIGMVLAIFFGYRQMQSRKKLDEFLSQRKTLMDRLADPKRIEEEMELGARRREMHDANRTTLPREDAKGQNARVFRPKMRSKLPSRWNPPRA